MPNSPIILRKNRSPDVNLKVNIEKSPSNHLLEDDLTAIISVPNMNNKCISSPKNNLRKSGPVKLVKCHHKLYSSKWKIITQPSFDLYGDDFSSYHGQGVKIKEKYQLQIVNNNDPENISTKYREMCLAAPWKEEEKFSKKPESGKISTPKARLERCNYRAQSQWFDDLDELKKGRICREGWCITYDKRGFLMISQVYETKVDDATGY